MHLWNRLTWPLPALLVWGLAWVLFLQLGQWLAPWAALGAACLPGTAASLTMHTWWRRTMVAAGFPVSFLVMLVGQMGSVAAWAWLVPLVLLLMVYPLNAWRDAPVFPTPRTALDELGARIALPEGAAVLDAGCGAGDGLLALRRAWPQARIFGLEWSWPLRLLCALRCPWAVVRQGDMWDMDWRPFDMVYLFQRPETMPRAGLKAMLELRPGAWLVSLNFPLPDTPATHTALLPDGRGVYAYRAPLSSDAPDEAASAAAELVAQHNAQLCAERDRLFALRRPRRGIFRRWVGRRR